ncbi:MAG: TIGR03986 family CRISPR-associated RAMP protein, partial [Acidobacteriota bacterium]
ADGDMTLGFGASKGYGACTATIEWPPDRAQWIASFSSQFEPRLDSPASVPPVTHLDQQPTLGVAPKPPSTSSPEFHNPYQFVPVSSKRGHHAKVNDSPANVGHDRYVPGTFSGRLRCRLRTLTPVVIGAEQTGPKTESKKVEPFRDPDTGKPAIPASSLRGLISSIAEAASNSSLRVLENKEYEVRVDRKQRRVNGTAHDFFARVSKELLPFNGDRETVTIAEEIFGYVDASGAPTAKALAGRVRFSMARLARDGGDRNLLLPAVPLRILSSPKPPSPAMYFNPSTGDGYVSKQELSVESHRPKGRKFYLHNPESWSGDPWKTNSPAVNPDQKVIVTPVAKGVSFFFDIDFDNLSEVELGLICYALRPSSTFMHKIGMGKSLGLGSVEIDPVALLLTDRQRRYRSSESSRFDSCDLHDSRPTMWPSSNDLEEARGIPPAEVCLAHFRASFRSGMQEGIRDALEAIGDPHLLRRPVHLPQRTGLDLEEETFKWFVKNDSDGVKHQYLRTVVKTIPVLSGVFERRQSAADGPGTARRPGPTPPTPPPPPPAPNEAIAQWIDASLSYDEERQKIMIVAPGQKRVIADANDPRCKEIALAIKEQGSLIRTVTVRAIDQRRYELIEIHSQ